MKNQKIPFAQSGVMHDNIDIIGTINYTERYRLYNDMENLINAKINQARHTACGAIIRVNMDCTDVDKYTSQTKRMFELATYALENGVCIETNVISPLCLDGWAGRFLTEYATPGYRNIFQDAYIYHLDTATNARRLLSHRELFDREICDTIFMNNGTIKTR